MGLLFTSVGGAIGITLKMWCNSVLKVPLRREPWQYVTYGVIGAAIFRQIPIWKDELTDEIDRLRARRNMPPINREGATIMFGG